MRFIQFSATQITRAMIMFLAMVWIIQPNLAAAGAPLDALQLTGQKVRMLLSDTELKKPEHVSGHHRRTVQLRRNVSAVTGGGVGNVD